MPCTYTGSLEGDARLVAREELDKLTRLLCEAGKVYHSTFDREPSDELLAWWKKHAKVDKDKKVHKLLKGLGR